MIDGTDQRDILSKPRDKVPINWGDQFRDNLLYKYRKSTVLCSGTLRTMSGRAVMRTPEPPDRDEHEDSPPRLSRPKRTTRPPNNYAREQEVDPEKRKTRSQRKKKSQDKPVAQHDLVSSDD